ncbi:hypothetical protein APR41_12250 [Salegentibacter salinarum]|uniref:Uncharacterized protein n=1 Tax=Salegentibacter salinarum TaxID=447422 RepID=A0A2N0U2G1_9FLAO|nr:hypothetical protein [Salegentibacter salinarum]PKD21179.1 hypothetical protein APR41_12250 [Salegentibacter salinarum]
MSVAEIDKLHQFREEDTWINSVEDFQKTIGISDFFLGTISPYFKFPDWVIEAEKKKKYNRNIPSVEI